MKAEMNGCRRECSFTCAYWVSESLRGAVLCPVIWAATKKAQMAAKKSGMHLSVYLSGRNIFAASRVQMAKLVILLSMVRGKSGQKWKK